MEIEENMKLVTPSGLPPDIWVAIAPAGAAENRTIPKGRGRRKLESSRGRRLAATLASEKLGSGELKIRALDNGKPEAEFNGLEVGISIAHCPDLIGVAISKKHRLGLDLECAERRVKPTLLDRILNPAESEIRSRCSPIQIWTIKEAVLKWTGSGLRTPMRDISILGEGKPLFYTEISDGKCLNICTFKYQNHWISIAFD